MMRLFDKEFAPKSCSMCGSEFELWDHCQDFCIDRGVGYGSKYDFSRIQLDLCCACFDKVMDWIVPQCVSNPVSYPEIPKEVLDKELEAY